LHLPLHPSAQRLSTPFPVSEIWQVHQPDAPAVDRIDMNGSGERLLIWRQHIDIRWRKLNPGEDLLLAELSAGAPLGKAAWRLPDSLASIPRQLQLDAGWRDLRPAGGSAAAGRIGKLRRQSSQA